MNGKEKMKKSKREMAINKTLSCAKHTIKL
jgi:hypothetical protein